MSSKGSFVRLYVMILKMRLSSGKCQGMIFFLKIMGFEIFVKEMLGDFIVSLLKVLVTSVDVDDVQF